MMYPFMTLEDKTEVVHSEILDEHDTVKVYFEKPVEGGFLTAECYLPDYKWKEIDGFIRDDIDALQEFLESTAHIIIQLAREGGYDEGSNFNDTEGKSKTYKGAFGGAERTGRVGGTGKLRRTGTD